MSAMRKSQVQSIVIISAAVCMLAGCGMKNQPASGIVTETPKSADIATPSVEVTTIPAPILQSEVSVFYSDNDLSKLIEKKMNVTYAKSELKYEAVFNALKKSNDPAANSLFEGVTFRSMELKEDGLHMDISIDPNKRLGAPGEDLFIKALQQTAFQFPEVKAVFVLVEGKQIDSIMGHVELKFPMKRAK
jgi:hypothetical protein